MKVRIIFEIIRIAVLLLLIGLLKCDVNIIKMMIILVLLHFLNAKVVGLFIEGCAQGWIVCSKRGCAIMLQIVKIFKGWHILPTKRIFFFRTAIHLVRILRHLVFKTFWFSAFQPTAN
jgi:hypothetical protein